MVDPSPLFKTLSVEPDPQPSPQQSAQQQAVAIRMIQIALSALWQQFIISLAHLFTLASGASVFVLFLSIADPNTRQLVMLGGYAVFVLAANWLVIGSRK